MSFFFLWYFFLDESWQAKREARDWWSHIRIRFTGRLTRSPEELEWVLCDIWVKASRALALRRIPDNAARARLETTRDKGGALQDAPVPLNEGIYCT